MKKYILSLILIGLAVPAVAEPRDTRPGAVAPKVKIEPKVIERPGVAQLERKQDEQEPPPKAEICHSFVCAPCREINRSFTGTFIKEMKEASCPTQPSSCDVNSPGACAGLNDAGMSTVTDPMGQ
jgi:hypothetical protein